MAKAALYLYYSNVHFDFRKGLENSSQRAYFRSCDENTATPLADKREMEDLRASLCPIERFDLYAI